MTRRVKVSRRAAAQIRGAAEWWQSNRPGAPGAIAADFGAAIALLSEQPGVGAKYQGARALGVRRLFLSRVGYFIYYKADDDQLQVLAFWHASRGHQPVL
ncbi:type II toxin-antitoxin system RelE/ParE family toxin [Variovorax sp. KK3]|uniref:type II toxin-antitoxin system RelE/ParE family toxin n=1 Tax=Variovorax sp. KK3 TaxID=1855728 RepID=UPI00097C1024|nr:type II toxin-antitoxin system RelE/ParE family toxin [Variovorax sp. KK3]